LWEVNSEECVATLVHDNPTAVFGTSPPAVLDCSVTNKGRGIVLGMYDGTLRLWDIPSQKQVQVFYGHVDCVNACGVLEDESTIVSASRDSSLKIWSMNSGRCELTLQGHDQGVPDFAVVPNSLNIVSVSFDGTIRIWDIRTRKHFRTMRIYED